VRGSFLGRKGEAIGDRVNSRLWESSSMRRTAWNYPLFNAKLSAGTKKGEQKKVKRDVW